MLIILLILGVSFFIFVSIISVMVLQLTMLKCKMFSFQLYYYYYYYCYLYYYYNNNNNYYYYYYIIIYIILYLFFSFSRFPVHDLKFFFCRINNTCTISYDRNRFSVYCFNDITTIQFGLFLTRRKYSFWTFCFVSVCFISSTSSTPRYLYPSSSPFIALITLLSRIYIPSQLTSIAFHDQGRTL